MDSFWNSVLGNLLADAILFGAMGLVSILYARAKIRIGKIGTKLNPSPDSEKFASEVEGEIYVTDKNGTRNLTHSIAKESGAMWAGNSRWLAYAQETSGRFQVIVSDVDTNKAVCLTEGMGSARPVEWHRDGHLIVNLGGSFLTVYRQEIEKRLG